MNGNQEGVGVWENNAQLILVQIALSFNLFTVESLEGYFTSMVQNEGSLK